MNNKAPKRLIKEIKKLRQKKYREQTGLFLADRWKIISLFIQNDWEVPYIFTIKPLPDTIPENIKVYSVTKEDLRQISPLKNPYDALAVIRMKPAGQLIPEGLIPVMDAIQDPGNLGTLIRTADWFGIKQIVCLPGTADVYNPKAIQASMGAVSNMKVFYTDYEELNNWVTEKKMNMWAADMKGENIYTTTWPKNFFLVFGNEGHGFSEKTLSLIQRRISIPHADSKVSESLNISMAAGIIMGQWFGKNYL